jgi:hypothetical protein
MPIEDIDYLKANSIKEQYIFLVNSADRDYNTYPTPSEYVINFTTPFRNVIGLQVIDASIPRTMYCIDIYNNTLSFFIYDSTFELQPTSIDSTFFTTISIDTGDYTFETLVSMIGSSLNMNLNGDPSKPSASIFIESLSNPPEIKSKIRLHSPYTFIFDMTNSTMAETLGFDTQVNPNLNDNTYTPIIYDTYYYLYNQASVANATYIINHTNNIISFRIGDNNSLGKFIITEGTYTFVQLINQINKGTGLSINILSETNRVKFSSPLNFQINTQIPGIGGASVINNTNFKLYGSVNLSRPYSDLYQNIIYNGPRGVVRNNPISLPNTLAQSFVVSSRGYLVSVNAALYVAAITNQSTVYWKVYKNNVATNQPGDLIQLQDINGNNLSQGTIEINYTDGGFSSTVGLSTMLEVGTYWIVFYANVSEISIYYNDIAASIQNNPMLTSNNNGSSWQSLDTIDGIHFEASIQITLQDEYHTVVAPGLYNLITIPYVILRCSEIEEHSYRYLAYTKHFLGIAKFNISSVGYNHNGLNLSAFPSREFHPIGKLNKITLRFEMPNGNLYDFKGINHNITFAISYYEPIQNQTFKQSILNPNYQGNFISYLVNEQGQEEDSDDQEEEYNVDDINSYRAMESRYSPEQIARIDRDALYLQTPEHPAIRLARSFEPN